MQIEKCKSKSDSENENDSQVYLKEALHDSTIISDGRRQSTPVLVDNLNVFSASLRITIPDESARQVSHSVEIKGSTFNSEYFRIPSSNFAIHFL